MLKSCLKRHESLIIALVMLKGSQPVTTATPTAFIAQLTMAFTRPIQWPMYVNSLHASWCLKHTLRGANIAVLGNLNILFCVNTYLPLLYNIAIML